MITKYIVDLCKHKIFTPNSIIVLHSIVVPMNAVEPYSSLISYRHTCAQSTKTRQNVAKIIIQILCGFYWISLLLRRALCIHLIYYTPTNALLYCNSLKYLH